VVEREAREQGIDLAAHYAHLLVHGALHAQGMDHLDDAQAATMEARESAILVGLGYADPYAGGG
jgi:probable rRNA maturation factor